MNLNSFYTFASRWLFSTNHKDIGILYIIFGGLSGVIGTLMSIVIRNVLTVADNTVIINDNFQLYNVLVTGHAILMIFFYGNAYFNWRIWKLFRTYFNWSTRYGISKNEQY